MSWNICYQGHFNQLIMQQKWLHFTKSIQNSSTIQIIFVTKYPLYTRCSAYLDEKLITYPFLMSSCVIFFGCFKKLQFVSVSFICWYMYNISSTNIGSIIIERRKPSIFRRESPSVFFYYRWIKLTNVLFRRRFTIKHD